MTPSPSILPWFTSRRSREIGGVVLFYFFFSFLYHLVLWQNSGGSGRRDPWSWLELHGYWLSAGMQYTILLLASVLIWWLGIHLLRRRRPTLRIAAVVLMIPFAVYCVRLLRYAIIDSQGGGRLRGSGEIWDLYIPALFLMVQFGSYFAYTAFRENEAKLKVEAELRQSALKSEISAIKAQLNPHFLYNVFNTINASLPPESEGTRRMISQLSDLFRYQLRATKEESVPLREELDFVRNYLGLERSRFGERLRVRIEVEEALLDRKVPPMILQPLVENSVRHGLSSLIDGGSVTVSITEQDDELLFRVADTGVGISDKQAVFGSGVGLTNTRFRLQKKYGSDLQLSDNQPHGLVVSFRL